MLNLQSMENELINHIEHQISNIHYMQVNKLLLDVEVTKQAIVIKVYDKEEMSKRIRNLALSITLVQENDCLLLMPPSINKNAFIFPDDFLKMIFATLIEALVLYAKENNITQIQAGKNDKELNGAMSIFRHWSTDFVQVLLASHFTVSEENSIILKDYWKKSELYKQNTPNYMVYKFDVNLFTLDVEKFVYILPSLMEIKNTLVIRAQKRPLEEVNSSFFERESLCNINVSNAHSQDSTVLITCDTQGKWQCKSDFDIYELKLPLSESINSLIDEVHKHNKMSYLLNPKVDNLHKMLGKTFDYEQLYTLMVAMMEHGLDCIEIENEAYLFLNKRENINCNAPIIKLAKMGTRTYIIQLRNTFIFISDEYTDELDVKISDDIKEIMSFFASLNELRLNQQLS